MKKVNEFEMITLLDLLIEYLATILYFVNFKILRNLQKSFFLSLRKMKTKGFGDMSQQANGEKFYFIKFCEMV